MKIGLGLSTKRNLGKYLRIADVADVSGFDTFWVPDMNPTSPYLEQYITLAAIATITEKMHIGPGVSNPYTRHPVMIARAIATLSDLAQNRVFIGLGAGGSLSLRPLGFETWKKPYKTVESAVIAIKKLFSGEKVTIDAPTFKVRNLVFDKEEKRKIPIYLGVRGPKMLELAGRIADGVILSSSIDYISVAKKYISKGLTHSKRSLDDFRIINWLPSSFAKDPYESRESVKLRVSAYLLFHSPRLLKESGIDMDLIKSLRTLIASRDMASIKDLIKDSLVDNFAICGSKKSILEKIYAFKDAGVSEIVLGDPFSDNEIHTINKLRKSLIPLIKKI